jgi:predicted branched-subunit amino acid permease
VIYSASLAPCLRPKNVPTGIAYGYLIRDGAYALTVTRSVKDPASDTPAYYVGAAFTDWAMWIAATTAGAFGAAFVPEALSLEFIVPLVFIALLTGALENRTDVETAVITAVAAAVLVPLLPLRTGLIAAIAIGVAWAFFRDPDPDSAQRCTAPEESL